MTLPSYWIYLIVLHLTLATGDVAVELEWPISSVRSASGLPFAVDGNTSTCFKTPYGAGQDLLVSMKKSSVVTSVGLYLPRGYYYISISTSYNNKDNEVCQILEETIEYDQWVIVRCRGKSLSNKICVRNKSGLSSKLVICEVDVHATTDGTSGTTNVYGRTTPRAWRTSDFGDSTLNSETTNNQIAITPSYGSTAVSKTAIIASAVVVIVLILTCTIVVIFIVQKKRSEPVVVVLNRGESTSGSGTFSEPEYSAINYDTIGPSNVTVISHPPVPCPRTPAFSKARSKNELHRPPPYYQPLAHSTPPGVSGSTETIKISSLYVPSP